MPKLYIIPVALPSPENVTDIWSLHAPISKDSARRVEDYAKVLSAGGKFFHYYGTAPFARSRVTAVSVRNILTDSPFSINSIPDFGPNQAKPNEWSWISPFLNKFPLATTIELCEENQKMVRAKGELVAQGFHQVLRNIGDGQSALVVLPPIYYEVGIAAATDEWPPRHQSEQGKVHMLSWRNLAKPPTVDIVSLL